MASRTDIGPRIGLEGEKAYRDQISKIIQAQKQLKAELKGTEAAFRADTSEREKSERRTKLLNEQLANENQKLRDQKAMLEALEKANKGSSKRAEELRTAIARTGAEIERIKKNLADNNYAVAVGRDMQAAGQKIKQTGDGIAKFGTTLTKTVTVPLAAAGAAAVKLATDFETSLAKLDSIADSSSKSMDTLKSEILALSNSSGIAASELAEQAYQAISAGQDTADSVRFVESSAKLAKAGFTETGAALDVLTTIMNAYGLSASQVTSVSDKLINTQNLGKVTVAQLAESMGDAIPTAASMGVNLDQLASVYVTLTKQGINAASATTQVNGLMNQLGKSGAKASDALKKKTGKSFQELMKAGYSLTDVLEIVNEEAEENGVSLNDMFGNIRAGRAALALMNDGGETFTETLKSMSAAAGATDEAFEKVTDTSAYRFQVALNKVKNTGIDAGNELMKIAGPALEKFADVIDRATKGFANLSEKEQQIIIKTAMFAAAIGPATTALGKMTSGVGSAIEGAGRLIEKFGLTGTIGVPAILGISAAFVALNIAIVEAFNAQVKYNNEFAGSFRESQKAIEASKKLRDAVKESGDAYEESTGQIEANQKKASRLADELEKLSSKTNRSEEENRRMTAAVEELNSIYPDLNLKIDANTGRLNKNNQEIRDSIKNYAEQAKAIAAQERAVEINKQIFEIESQIIDLKEQRTAAEKTVADAIAASTAEGEKYGHMTARGKAIADEAALKYNELNTEISTQETLLASLNGQLESTEQYIGQHTTALQEDTVASDAGTLANEALVESYEAEAAAAEAAAEKVREGARLSVSAFEEVKQAQTKSIDDIISALQSQVTAQQNYRSNLQTLNAYIQKDTKHNWDQVVKILTEGGIDMAGELQGIVNAIESGDTDALEALAALTAGVEDETEASGEALLELANTTGDAFNAIPGTIKQARPKINTEAKLSAREITSGWKTGSAGAGPLMATDAGTALKAPISAINAKKSEVRAAAKATGQAEPEGFKEGANSKKGEAASAAGGVVDAARDAIKGKGPSLKEASNKVAADSGNALAIEARKKQKDVIEAGQYMADGLAKGMDRSAAKVQAAADRLASAAVNKMKAVPQVSSPSKVTTEIGEYMGQGLINGMLEKIRETKMAAAALATAALPGIGGNTYMDADIMGGLDPEEMYNAVREGAASASRSIYLNGREVTRGLKDLGVSFA